MDSHQNNLNLIHRKRQGASKIAQIPQSTKKLKTTSDLKKPKSRNRKLFKMLILTVIFSFLVVVGIFIYNLITAASSIVKFDFGQTPIKQENGRINVLLLGNGGGTHSGASLTDSIIVASYDLKTKKALLISVPRDLWLDNLKMKVNAVYEAGNWDRNGGDGLKFAKQEIGNIVGLPINYAARIDFNGFTEAVDLVDGIDVNVPRSFDDYNYPVEGKESDLCGYQIKELPVTEEIVQILNLKVASSSATPSASSSQGIHLGDRLRVFINPAGQVVPEPQILSCRYEHISFKQGLTHMDGTTALKFVRSRKGNNGEGSDFARSGRQQLVLEAFRTKALSIQTLSNPQKVLGLINTLGKSMETDIPASQIPDFYGFAKNMGKVDNIVLGDLGNGQSVLINPPMSQYGGAWVLVPEKGSFKVVQDLIKNKIAEQEGSASASLN